MGNRSLCPAIDDVNQIGLFFIRENQGVSVDFQAGYRASDLPENIIGLEAFSCGRLPALSHF